MQTFQLRARKARALLSPSYLPWIKIVTVLSRPWPRWFENQNTETMSSRKPPQSDLAAESTDLTLIVARRPSRVTAGRLEIDPHDLERAGGHLSRVATGCRCSQFHMRIKHRSFASTVLSWPPCLRSCPRWLLWSPSGFGVEPPWNLSC